MKKSSIETLIKVLKQMKYAHFDCVTALNNEHKFNASEKRLAEAAGTEIYNKWNDAMQIALELLNEAE